MGFRVIVGHDAASIGTIVADLVTATAPAVLGVATGSSPLRAYGELVRRGTLDAETHLTLLDEYVGLPRNSAHRYRATIARELAEPAGIPDAHLHAPDVDAVDLDDGAARYDRLLIDVGGVDLQILGIGRNGHIGFNEPSTAFTARTHVADLLPSTRADNARFFDHQDDVPRRVITQGLATISAARRIVLIAIGHEKRAAIAAAFTSPPCTDHPASSLVGHPDLIVVGDRSALADIADIASWPDPSPNTSPPRTMEHR